MAMKSSRRGAPSVVSQQEAQGLSSIGAVSTRTVEMQKSSVHDDPYEVWLCYQAQSYLRRPVTVDEAKQLWTEVDIHTRKPIIPPAPPSPLSRLLAALRAWFAVWSGTAEMCHGR